MEDLPLYGAEDLNALPDGATVVVTEGEKAAQALVSKGIPAVGTVTAAGGTPSLATLRPLVRLSPILWEDNDEVGRGHMARIAARLHELGCQTIKMVSWPDAPCGGDAADTLEAERLIEQAQVWQAPLGEDAGELLDAVEDIIRRYVVTGDAERAALSLWAMHTHAFAAAEATPYLNITSPEKQSGKTLLLEVLSLFVALAWFTSRVSSAALMRKVARDTPSLLLDESDTAFKTDKEYAETLRGLLNSGYRLGGMACVCEGRSGEYEVKDFPTFCPKALAGIGKLPDTVADRSIRISLKRRAPSEQVERFRLRTAKAEAAPLKERLEKWGNAAVAKLIDARPTLPEGLSDRACDVWEPLLAIADLAGGVWPAKARESAIVLSTGALDSSFTLGVRLLHDIREVLGDRDTPIPTTALLEALRGMEEAPWSDLRGRPLDPMRLSRLLKPYEIKPKVVRVGDATPRGYYPEDFQDTWERYCASTLQKPVLGATGATKSQISFDLGQKDVAPSVAPSDLPATLGATEKEAVSKLKRESVAGVAEVAPFPGVQEKDTLPLVLGMPAEKAIEIWQSAGAPMIHLGDGENTEHLDKLLTRHDISERHLEAIRVWLQEMSPDAELVTPTKGPNKVEV